MANFHIARTLVDVPFYIRVHSETGITLSLATTNGDEFYSKSLGKLSKDKVNALLDELKVHIYQKPYDTKEALVESTEAFFVTKNESVKSKKKEKKAA